MKRLTSMLVMTALVAVTAWAHVSNAAGYGGRGGGQNFGIQGTISSIGSTSFIMTTDGGGEGKPAKEWKVTCNANTKFMEDGKQVSASAIKVGTHVGILGGPFSPTELIATTVNIGSPSNKKK